MRVSELKQWSDLSNDCVMVEPLEGQVIAFCDMTSHHGVGCEPTFVSTSTHGACPVVSADPEENSDPTSPGATEFVAQQWFAWESKRSWWADILIWSDILVLESLICMQATQGGPTAKSCGSCALMPSSMTRSNPRGSWNRCTATWLLGSVTALKTLLFYLFGKMQEWC